MIWKESNLKTIRPTGELLVLTALQQIAHEAQERHDPYEPQPREDYFPNHDRAIDSIAHHNPRLATARITNKNPTPSRSFPPTFWGWWFMSAYRSLFMFG